MPSQGFNHLKNRLEELKRFVAFDIPIERYATIAELDSIACFKLLMHAEIETFLEDRITCAINRTLDKWRNDRIINRCAFNLLLIWHKDLTQHLGPFATAPSYSNLTDILEACQKKSLLEIKQNNSIKQAAFTKLAALAGMMLDEHAMPLLAALESFGKTRGDIAHLAIGRITTLNSPEVEYSEATQLLSLLEQFDDDIEGIVR